MDLARDKISDCVFNPNQVKNCTSRWREFKQYIDITIC